MSLKSKFKGWCGELVLVIAKKIALDGKVYKDLNNVTLRTDNGTTQIDHIIISRYGIFVIETKNMEGYIYGAEFRPQWTQMFRGQKYRFQNPIFQNHRHVKALEAFLGLGPDRLFPMVCFVGEACKLKVDAPGANVFHGGGFHFIRSKTDILFTDDEVDEIVAALKAGMLPKNFLGLSTRATQREHLGSLAARHGSTTSCPKCGKDLVLRTVKKGQNEGAQFLGCSGFPSCRYRGPLQPADTAEPPSA